VAYYTNLPPGRYQFRVAAFEVSDPQQVAETAVEIVKRPHFYRTAWFVGCSLLLLSASVWGGYRFRMRQVQSRFQAVLSERNRLAREMHDTLIQGCAGVSALLEAHSSLDDTEASAKDDLLSVVRTQLRTTINEAREAVWDLRHADGSATAIGPILGNMTQQVGHEFGVPVEYRISGRPFDLDQSTAHELLMVVREALHNAMRHGQPTKVHVDIVFEKKKFRVQVRDDGCGFDPEVASSQPNGHYGLIGIQERAKRIGAVLILKSWPGVGTELALSVPRKASTTGNGVSRI
jgi:signal transduction histidine kinase